MGYRYDSLALAKALQHKRVESDLSTVKAALHLGISISKLNRIENEVMPDLITYNKLCDWLELPMTHFVKKE